MQYLKIISQQTCKSYVENFKMLYLNINIGFLC